MKSFRNLVFSLLLVLIACDESVGKNEIDRCKAEIIKVEKVFDDMAQKEGLAKAFYAYAANDGVIKRGKKVVVGNEAMREWYKENTRPNETLTWKPTFVDVSSSGDLAYTYGDYTFTSIDSVGLKKETKGIFHTVWKRHRDGNRKFVWH